MKDQPESRMTLSYVERRDLNVRTVSSESRLGARQRRVVRRPSLRLQQAVDCASIALDRSMISGNIGKVVAGQAGYIRSTFANQQLRIAMRCDAMRCDAMRCDSTRRSSSQTSCPATQTTTAIVSRPSGSSRRKKRGYIKPLGCTACAFVASPCGREGARVTPRARVLARIYGTDRLLNSA
jgi:hypothetical protein